MSGNNQKTNKGFKKIIKKALYAVYLFLVVFIALEIFLRIYNPFPFRLKGDKIILPINQTTIIHNTINPKLDSQIVNSRNALGFRGPEMPPHPEDYLSIITIGGSTTECRFLNDDKTWPFLTGKKLEASFDRIWLNNAGFDGHSTYGHQVLLDYIVTLHPKVVTFLIGINDVESDKPSFHDNLNTKGAYSDFKHYIAANSEVVGLIVNFARGWKAQKMNNTTQKYYALDKNNNLVLPDSVIARRLSSQDMYLPNYRQRILELMDTCLAHGIRPVFITQPDLFGVGTDSVTGANLATIKLNDAMNGSLLWQMLERYNDVTRKVCAQKSIRLIDLAELMPKNSLYFYDASHFTNAGAEKVADIISTGLKEYLATQFTNFQKK